MLVAVIEMKGISLNTREDIKVFYQPLFVRVNNVFVQFHRHRTFENSVQCEINLNRIFAMLFILAAKKQFM